LERGLDSEAAATALLEAALADERLVNLEARTFFEWRTASLIAGGWRPGHEYLFRPAAAVFGWDDDRRRLALFGPVGALVDAAIRERLIFFGQENAHFELQRKLIRRLRADQPPTHAELAHEIALLGLLLQRYPNWMRVMTRQEIVQHWIATWNAMTPEQRGKHDARKAAAANAPPPSTWDPKRSKSGSGGFRGGWILVMVVIGVIRAISSIGDSGGHRYQPPPVTTTSTLPPTRYAPPAPAAPDWARNPVNGSSDMTFVDGSNLGTSLAPLPTTPAHPAAAKPPNKADAERLRLAIEKLEHTNLLPPTQGQPQPAPTGNGQKYRLESKPEPRVDTSTLVPTTRRFDTGYTPPADLSLTSSPGGGRVKGLADLANPPRPATTPPADPAN